MTQLILTYRVEILFDLLTDAHLHIIQHESSKTEREKKIYMEIKKREVQRTRNAKD